MQKISEKGAKERKKERNYHNSPRNNPEERRSLLSRVLKSTGFIMGNCSIKRRILFENHKLVLWRQKYLLQMERLQADCKRKGFV
jgi:hypothetical protein